LAIGNLAISHKRTRSRVIARPNQLKRRLGFMAGQIAVPDDFDWAGETEIERWSDGKG